MPASPRREHLQKLVAQAIDGEGDSLLHNWMGAPSPADDEAVEKRRAGEAMAVEISRYLLQCLLNGYAAGDLTFEKFCRQCRDASAAKHMPPFQRQKLLGALVEAALTLTPPKRPSNKARPLWLAEVCHQAVEDVVKHEGLPLVRESSTHQDTAFARAADILSDCGIRGMTPTSVAAARTQWRKHTGTT